MGAQQGDLLSLFIFLMVVEGLSALVHNVIALGEFQGFHTNEVHFKALQFADDTMLIANDSWNNLWSIKYFLRSFKLVSEL